MDCCPAGRQILNPFHGYPIVVTMPEAKRWAETEAGREMLKHMREMIESMKADGLEVRDLEEFLKSPHPTREGVEYHQKVFLKRSGGNEGNLKVFASQKSPQVVSEERYYRFESRSTGKDTGEAAGPEKAVLHGCPRCGKTVKPGWKSCPFCRSSLVEPRLQVEPPGPLATEPPAGRCPECHGRVGPKDRKCPVCGHRLKPWSLFG